MYAEFVRERISRLRLQKGVSEYQMSYDLGHSRGYVNNISSGKALPSMNEFFSICEYFGITPVEFFDVSTERPELVHKATQSFRLLDDEDMLLILTLLSRLQQKQDAPHA